MPKTDGSTSPFSNPDILDSRELLGLPPVPAGGPAGDTEEDEALKRVRLSLIAAADQGKVSVQVPSAGFYMD